MKRLVMFVVFAGVTFAAPAPKNAASAPKAAASAPKSNNIPGMPAWTAEERKQLEASGWVPGALLLTDDPLPEETAAPAEVPLNVEQPKPEEIEDDLKSTPEIAEKYLNAYFAERPASFLVDPQGLLSPVEYRDRLRFLTDHAADSSIDLFVYVIGGEQEIPTAVRKEEIIERFFSEGRPAEIVFYYLGAPQRSSVYLSPSIMGSIPNAEQRRALESSVNQAFERTKAPEQLEKFLVQMSIRIYWMERMLAGEPTPDSQPLHARAAAKAKVSEKMLLLHAMIDRFAVPGAITAGAALTLFGLMQWLKLRVRYRFPEFEVEPRLGGAHAAGIGAVISFASASLPPASQRDQVPDYLRRA